MPKSFFHFTQQEESYVCFYPARCQPTLPSLRLNKISRVCWHDTAVLYVPAVACRFSHSYSFRLAFYRQSIRRIFHELYKLPT